MQHDSFWLKGFSEGEVCNEDAGGVDRMLPTTSVASSSLLSGVCTWKLPSSGIQTDVWLLEIYDGPLMKAR